jgi:hypothetical protein
MKTPMQEMFKLIRIERTERVYEVELTEEQYELSIESDEGFDKIYEEMSGKLELARIKEGPNSKFTHHEKNKYTDEQTQTN